jgi:hypothetical protein
MGSYAAWGDLPPMPGTAPDETVMDEQQGAPAQLPQGGGQLTSNHYGASQELQQAVGSFDPGYDGGRQATLSEQGRGVSLAPGAYAMARDYPGGPVNRQAYGDNPITGGPGPADARAPSSGMLGAALAVVAVGAVVGWKYGGGLFGGLAGAFAGGALINGYRAAKNVTQGLPETDREAAVSATYAVVGGGAALFLLYQAKKDGKLKRNSSSKDDEDDDAEPNESDDAEPNEADGDGDEA